MGYTIGQAAKKSGLSPYTLRFYEKEGLLPNIRKNSAGLRVFSQDDINWLQMIECLKGTGMSLKNIKQYLAWLNAGNTTINQRLQMFQEQKEKLRLQMQLLDKYMEKINFKIKLYTLAAQKGDMDVYKANPELEQERERIFGVDNPVR